MKVALIAHAVEAASPGLQCYWHGLTEGLLALDDGNDYTPIGWRLRAGEHAEAPVPGRMWRSALIRQVQLPPYLSERGFDVVHDMYHFGPFLRPAPYARVLTIGDLTPLVTNSHSARRQWAHRLIAPVIAHRAHGIVTFSENSKRDIVRLFRVPPDRVIVAYLAASDRFRPITADQVEIVRTRLGLPKRYVVHVGTIEPRKNISTLVRAFAAALPELGDTALLLVGRQGWRMESLPDLIARLGLEDRVVVRSRVTADDLPAVYGGALALAYPSVYEGFGLPPLEAMQCGVPVITSNVSSLPEVVGDAALTVNPASVDELARALVAVAQDAGLRDRLRERGLQRAATFTWRRCAEVTRSLYERAVVQARRPLVVAPQPEAMRE